ncbi:hypothetical protein FHR70_002528 [Microvirga lupini]|uniref:Outer membrane beta-barrel porin/alpha-amylase n=1 Tax=Microvirga lupini TaxID=420324 RepID=A0A7W4YXX7_9HYPH|nr:DUF6662 family protein [Microvirga lupini]MBB3019463.1 hypothetical protein [Microvirga lupini]
MLLSPVLRVAPALALMAWIHPVCAEGLPRRPPPRPAQPQRVQGQQKQQNQEDKQSQEGKQSESEIDTEDLFGFTEGSDVGDPGELEASIDSTGRFGHRGGRYRVFSRTLEVEYTPAERLSFAFDATFDRYWIRNVPDLENRNTGGLSQLSTQMRYQFIKRDPSPVGLTLSLEPQLGFFDQDTGERARRTALEAVLSLDTALVPERLFAAVNLTYEAERVRPRSFIGLDRDLEEVDPFDPTAVAVVPSPAERESTIGISGAVAYQAVPNLFVGAEAHYLRRYDGLDFKTFEGHALFIGPTLYVKVSDQVSLSAAWDVQVAGKASSEPGHLDLENFEHHQAKLKLIAQF